MVFSTSFPIKNFRFTLSSSFFNTSYLIHMQIQLAQIQNMPRIRPLLTTSIATPKSKPPFSLPGTEATYLGSCFSALASPSVYPNTVTGSMHDPDLKKTCQIMTLLCSKLPQRLLISQSKPCSLHGPRGPACSGLPRPLTAPISLLCSLCPATDMGLRGPLLAWGISSASSDWNKSSKKAELLSLSFADICPVSGKMPSTSWCSINMCRVNKSNL